MVACVAGGEGYEVSYIERRHGGDQAQLPDALGTISLRVGSNTADLKVVSSERRTGPDELVTYASGRVPSTLIGAFASIGNHSMMIKTESPHLVTGIRLGNTGAAQNLPRLSANCIKPIGDRAELSACKIGGLAAAK